MDKLTVLYTRLSKALDRDPDTGEVDPRNLPQQEAELRREAERLKLTNVRVLVEPGVSASKAHDEKRRVFYGDLVPMIERGEVEYVLATEVDRLTRYATAGLKFADLCEENGVTIVCPGQVTLQPGDDRMLFTIHCSLAEGGSRIMRRRATRYRARYREAGRARIGGRRMFGWDEAGTRLVPEEAALVKEAVQRILTGEPIYKVVREWNDRGLRTTEGNRWRPGGLRKNLLSMTHVSAVISDDEHAMLEGILAPGERDTVPGSPEPRTRPLTGLLRCGKCGSKLIGGPDAYRCAVINGGCGGLSVARFPAERWAAVGALRNRIARIRSGDLKPPREAPPRNVAPIHRELRAVKKQIAETEAEIEALRMPARSGTRILAKLDEKHTRLTKQLADALPVEERDIKPGAVFTVDELEDALGKKPSKSLFPDTGGADADFRERWEAGTLTPSEVDLIHDFIAGELTFITIRPAQRPGARFDEWRLVVDRFRRTG